MTRTWLTKIFFLISFYVIHYHRNASICFLRILGPSYAFIFAEKCDIFMTVLIETLISKVLVERFHLDARITREAKLL